MVLFGPVWSSMVLHEISDNYARQHEKALNRIIYHDIEKDGTRYQMLDSTLYHKIAIDRSFSNKLYPCAPIVRLIIFFLFICKEQIRF